MADTCSNEREHIIWEGRSAWMDHAVLYVFLAVGVVRAAVAAQQAQWPTVMLYGLMIACFLGIAAWFHYARVYRITSTRVLVRSGWTGRTIQELRLREITDVSLRYELLNRWFDLGALEIASRITEDCCSIRGIPDPETVKSGLDRWIRAQRSPWEPISARGTPDHAS